MLPTRSARLARFARADHSALAGVAPFDRYDARTLAPLGRQADRLRVGEGTVLAHAGRPVREVIRVLAGRVAVITAGGVECRGAGTWIGADPLLASTPHPATVVAGAGVEVLVLPAPAFRWAAQVLPGLVAGVRGPASGDVPGPPDRARDAEAVAAP